MRALLGAALLAASLAAQSQPIPRSDNNQHQDNAAHAQAAKSEGRNTPPSAGEHPFGYTSENNPQHEQEHGGLSSAGLHVWTWLVKFIEDPIAVFTALLFVFTALLWGVTYQLSRDARRSSRRQYIHTRQALRLARQEFVATHRPEISIHSIEPLDSIADDAYGLLRARVHYVNIGRSHAQIRRAEARILSRRAPVRGRITNNLIPITQPRVESGVRDWFDLSFLPDPAMTQNGFDVYCIGVIAYADATGNQRETGFFRMFHPGQNQWIHVQRGENEYEYQY